MDHPPSSTAEPTAYHLATQIAQHLPSPAGWAPRFNAVIDETGNRYALLVRIADGAELGVTIGGFRKEGRVTFRAHWPKYRDGRAYTPRQYLDITCAVQRDAKALAREIERRLLVLYDPAYRHALDEVRASDAAAASAWHVAERIARAVGAELPSSPPSNGAAVALHGGPSGVYGLKIHPAYGDVPCRVSVELNDLDEQSALEVLAIVIGNRRA